MTPRAACIAQALYAYFTGCELEEALQRPWPRHSVLQLTPVRNSHMFEETAISLDPGGGDSALADELSVGGTPLPLPDDLAYILPSQFIDQSQDKRAPGHIQHRFGCLTCKRAKARPQPAGQDYRELNHVPAASKATFRK